MKKKLLLTFSLCLFLILSFIGCVNKTPSTPDEFKTCITEKGYQFIDATSQFPAGSNVENVYLALKDDYQIEFLKVSTEEQAKAAFSENKSNFENMKGSTSIETSLSIGNHSRYNVKSDDTYMVVSRIDNTFIYLTVPIDYEEDVNEILDALGY